MFGMHDHPSLESAEESLHVLRRELKRDFRIIARCSMERGREYRVVLKEHPLPKGWEETD